MNVTPPPAQKAYRDAWQQYRRRNQLFWLGFFGYVPVCLLVAHASSRVFHTQTPAAVVAVLWMLAMVVVGNYSIRWRCPRCNQPFFAKSWYHNGFARKCVHCSLPKWEGAGP